MDKYTPNQVAAMIVFKKGTPKEAIRSILRIVESACADNLETSQVKGFNAATSYPTLYLP